jgi:hypothetical protein
MGHCQLKVLISKGTVRCTDQAASVSRCCVEHFIILSFEFVSFNIWFLKPGGMLLIFETRVVVVGKAFTKYCL